MAEARGPIDRAVDLLVYAPIGFAVLARDLGSVALADLAKRGRSEVDQTQKRLGNQITQYRFIGQYAVDQEIAPRVAPLVDEVKRVVDRFAGGIPGSTEARAPLAPVFTPTPATGNGVQKTAQNSAPTVTPVAAPVVDRSAEHAANREAAAALAIPDYDELSASQVVERLAGLTPSELTAVAAYEGVRRRRKTILTRIEQLTR